MKYKVKCTICRNFFTVNRFPGKGLNKIKCERCKENDKRSKNSIEGNKIN